jgi:hypothetical protein
LLCTAAAISNTTTTLLLVQTLPLESTTTRRLFHIQLCNSVLSLNQMANALLLKPRESLHVEATAVGCVIC